MGGFGCAGKWRPPTLINAQTTEADLLQGDWLGSWSSTQRDMGGELRCRVQKLDNGAYLAHFDAVFAKVFSNKSTVTLTVGQKDGPWTFSGKEDLGLLKGGVYTYQGQSDGSEFVCTYDSKSDKGTFRMTRPGATTQPSAQ